MNIMSSVPGARIAMVSGIALALSACGSSGSYRVASIGDAPAGPIGDVGSGGSGTGTNGGGTGSGGGSGMDAGGGGTGSSGGSGGTGSGTGSGTGTASVGPLGTVLVSAGNATIGLAGKHDALAQTVNGVLPPATPVTGTVTGVLAKSGQTLVDLGHGRTAVLASAKGVVGEVVTLNLGSHSVVGAGSGSSLLGVGVVNAAPATGTLASVNLGTGALSGVTGASGTVGTVVNGVAGAAGGTGATSVVGTVVNGVTGKAANVLGTVQGVVTPVTGALPVTGGLTAAGGASAGTGSTGAAAGGGLGLGGLLGKK